MVTNYTADQIGDIFNAKLATPFELVEKILGWNIVVGVTTPQTFGKLSFIDAITTVTCSGYSFPLTAGEQFIVGNITYTVDTVIDSNTFTVTEAPQFTATGLTYYLLPDANNFFNYEFSWSQEPLSSDGGQMSEFRPLNENLGPYDLLGIAFDSTKPLWLTLRLTVDHLGDANTISLLSVEYTTQTALGIIIQCPQFCTDCTDPQAMDGCANIITDCSTDLYNPYQLKQPSSMYRQLSELSTDIWGHQVKYFRVEPDQRSRDVILMEYSLYNVVEQGQVKIMVPDNEMPTQQFNYDLFGMGFDDFEVHLTKGQFEQAFGIGPSPRSRDYLYFPLINRMYEVSAVSYADEFNLNLTYWKLMLRKYEERTSSIVTDTAIEAELDALTVGIDEVFGEEIQDEYTQTTKPEQYKTVYSEVGDGTRYRIHNNLKISDGDIRNRWTIVSKNYYDLTSITDTNIEALVYNKKSELAVTNNLALTLWLRPEFTDNLHQTLFDGWENGKGLKVTISAASTRVYINGDMHTFDHDLQLENKTWYGLVLNINNGFKTISVSTYRLDPNSNFQNTNSNNKTITQANHKVINYANSYGWTIQKQYQLMPANLDLTNIRLFTKTIGLDQHMNVLQQYVVRDNQLAHIIDNAIPSIQLRRYDQSR